MTVRNNLEGTVISVRGLIPGNSSTAQWETLQHREAKAGVLLWRVGLSIALLTPDTKLEQRRNREISYCSLLSLPSLAALHIRKRKWVPELVCDKDHPPFQKQGSKDSAQMPHTEGCEQGLKINVLKPGVKRPPQLDDLSERKREPVSSCCPPILLQARTQVVFSQLKSFADCAGEHHTVSSPQTQPFQRPPTNPSFSWRRSRVHSNARSMRPTTSSPNWTEDKELFIGRKTSLCPAKSWELLTMPLWHSSSRMAMEPFKFTLFIFIVTIFFFAARIWMPNRLYIF